MVSNTGNNTSEDGGPTGGPIDGPGTDDAGRAYVGAACCARGLIRSGLKAALATFDDAPKGEPATPYASLVTTATSAAGAPVLLISKLARHTRNLGSNQRASLLFDGTGPTGDLLAGGRVTVFGRLEPTMDPGAARRFLSRHIAAEGYASFADFSFYEMDVEGAHYIGGFGRIVDVGRDDLLTELGGADDLLKAEPDIIAHMNDDHADAVALYATELLGAERQDGPWRLSGIDPAGIDIIGGVRGLRLEFETRVTTAVQARAAFKALAGKARAMAAKRR